MKIQKIAAVLMALALATTSLFADRTLDLKKAKKSEVSTGMIGKTSTKILYKFTEEKAVVTLVIGNKDTTFPITAKVHLFDKSVTSEGIDKWINNQTSDALFIDAAEPVSTQTLPGDVCKVTSSKSGEESGSPPAVDPPTEVAYQDYKVDFSVKEHRVENQFVLTAFSDTAVVHVAR
ncbi:MAG: hypothetical protein ACKO2G_10110 [Verrucomicrobiales bacterium]